MIEDLLKEKYGEMSKTQKRIAGHIIKNIVETSYSSVNALAKSVGTSEASIIRFCNFLGYNGFPELKKELQKTTKQHNSMQNRVRKSYAAYGEKEAVIAKVFNDDIMRIEKTLETMNMEDFFSACDEIILANRVFIIASRSAAALGSFFQYYLNMAIGNVQLIDDVGCKADVLSSIKSDETVIGLTFSRYARSTSELFHYAAEHNANMIGITDTTLSPIVPDSQYCFFTETSMPTYLDSFAAPLALINAFLTEIGRMRNVELEHRVTGLDRFYDEFGTFK